MKIKPQYNQRQDPQLYPVSCGILPTVERVSNLAIPFISLHKTGSKIVGVGLGSIQILDGLKEIYQGVARRRAQTVLVGLWKTTYSTAAIALMILLPVIHVSISQGVFLVRKTHDLYVHGRGLEVKQCLLDLLEISASLAYIASVVYGLPEWIALSLILQAINELSASISAFKEGKYPEVLSNLILAGIRGYGSKDSLMTLKRSYLGKRITQETWDQMIWDLSRETSASGKNLEKWLIDRGFSSHIEKIEAKSNVLERLDISHVQFHEMNFNGTYFNDSTVDDVRFKNCNLSNSNWVEAKLTDANFEHSNLEESNFYKASLHKVNFFATELLRANFTSSQLTQVHFDRLNLPEVSFLDARIQRSSMSHVDLTDTLLCDNKSAFQYKHCTENKITRPVVAMGWYFREPLRFAKMIRKVVEDQQGIVLLYDNQDEMDSRKLKEEVEELIVSMRKDKNSSDLSTAQKIFIATHEKGSSIEILKDYAKKIAVASDGIILPGGEDVEKVFYDSASKIDIYDDYMRSMKEFSLIEEFHSQKKQIMGVCRGLQIANVYFGGTLKNIPHQSGIKEFSLMDSKSPIQQVFKDLLGEKIHGISAHSMAADKIAPGFYVIYQDGTIPKLMANEDGSVLLSQFHPEHYTFFNDEIIKESILDARREIKAKSLSRQVIEQKLREIDMFVQGIEKVQENKKIYTFLFDRIRASKALQTA